MKEHNIWFSDKANKIINKQYKQTWTMGNLHVFTENVHYAAKIRGWAAISNHHELIKPLSFDKTVNSDSTCT
jgi:hypothetical protein